MTKQYYLLVALVVILLFNVAYAQSTTNNDTNNNMTALECALADQSTMTPETRQDCLDKMIQGMK